MSSADDLDRDALGVVEAAFATRSPESQLEPSLERIADLVDLLGHPQRTYSVVHVGGTNGKTSTTRIIDELIREMGLRTGRFTSPHLESVTESAWMGSRSAGNVLPAPTTNLLHISMWWINATAPSCRSSRC